MLIEQRRGDNLFPSENRPLDSAPPTVAEFLAGYEATTWWGIGVPRYVPTEIVGRLNKEINAALADANMKRRLEDEGATVLGGSPADFERLIAEETEKWGKVIRDAHIKPG